MAGRKAKAKSVDQVAALEKELATLKTKLESARAAEVKSAEALASKTSKTAAAAAKKAASS